MTGSSAAALTGLMFVVITLLTGRERTTETAIAGIAAFSTPTVMHFASSLLVSAVLTAPWHSLVPAGAAVALIGLAGVGYILRVAHRTWRLTMYRADLEDWVWYSVLPFISYGGIAAGAIILAAVPARAFFLVAGGVLLLLFTGIRNAWDVVTYIATRPTL